MSHYATVECEFRDEDVLVDALTELEPSWTVETHTVPQHLYGYHGDLRPEVAHIIVRRQYVGASSNDIGFVRGEDGRYSAIISEFDSHRHGAVWLGRLKQLYAKGAILEQLGREGKRMVKQEARADGSIELTVEV